MYTRIFPAIFFGLTAAFLSAQNQAPVILSFTATPNWPTQTLTIQYAVSDAENDPLSVMVEFSSDGGKKYTLTPQIPVSGDVGYPITPGLNKTISCDIHNLDMGQSPPAAYTVRLVVDDLQPLDLATLVAAVDSNRLRADLEFVQGVRHRTGGAAHLAAVRDSMLSLFQELSLYNQQHTFSFGGTYTGRNVLGTAPGTFAAQEIVIVDAHYDTVVNSPGADDNGSGVVGVLEAARVLSRYPARRSLRFMGFDLEESGLVGSKQYTANGIPADEQVMGVFNFEMIGYYTETPNSQELPAGFNQLFPQVYNELAANDFRGDFITNVGNAASASLAHLFDSTAAQYVPDLKVVTLVVPGNGQVAPDLRRSDHAAFWDKGLPALMLTDGADFRNDCYHTAQDTFDGKLSMTFLSAVVRATVAAAARLAELQHGDWATTTFQTPTLGAFQPRLCEPDIFYSLQNPRELQVRVNACPDMDVVLEILDMKGATMVQQQIPVRPGLEYTPVYLGDLPAGTYLARIRHTMGMSTTRFLIN